MKARFVLAAFLAAGAAAAQPPSLPHPRNERMIVESTVEQLQGDMQAGRVTAQSLVRAYVQRIRKLDQAGPKTASVVELNPDALAIAKALDRERAEGRVRGPLHGIPVLVKDNIDTADRMMTTAGSLALVGPAPSRDAFVVRRLREAGAVILGKANLSEWANIRSPKSSSGWSARGGQTRNAYALDRSPCGSSSGTGVAIAASYAAVGVGTETDGSITCPSHVSALVGLKPTVGLASRSGIVPIAISQDTAGPMTRTVADAAAVLSAIAGADPEDAATAQGAGRIEGDYRRFLDAGGLRGARIGVARKRVTGYSVHADRLFEAALADLARLGAELVDPADLGHAGEYDGEELEVLMCEFKDGLARYLATRSGLSVRTLADVIAFNDRHRDREMPLFGQEFFHLAQSKGPLTEAAYAQAAEKARRLARAGIDDVLQAHRLDAIVAPTGAPAGLIDPVHGDRHQGGGSQAPAVAGYPHLTVPMGQAHGLPAGLSFIGTAWSEGTLLRLGYAYEQGTRHRRAPTFAKSVVPEGAR